VPTFIERLAARAGFVRAAPERRNFDAAVMSRLTGTWPTAESGINAALWSGLAQMRARSRNLAKNDSYAQRFLAMVRANVVGPTGGQWQSRVVTWMPDGSTTPDVAANRIIEREWSRWARRGSCDITGRLSLVSLMQLYVGSLARDGEVLIRRVRAADNRHGYALQVLDVARLDETYNDDRPDGNIVRMSIELDRNTGRAVAYWLRKATPRDYISGGSWSAERERVPASDVWHDFVQHDPEQIRGVPWMHAAMTKLWQLGKFEEAAVIAARVGASKVGVIQSPTGEPPESVATGKDSAGNFLTDAEAGQYWTLPAGYELKGWDPTYPSDAFNPFLQACLRGVASGLNVSYVSLANNLEGVNYSSIRQGVLEEREHWKALQQHLADGFVQAIYADWLDTALLSGALAPLPISKRDKWDAMSWRGRRWAWVDPLKDRQESVLAIANGLKSRTQVCADEGLEFEEVLSELSAEQELAKRYNVALETDPPAPATDDGEDPPARAWLAEAIGRMSAQAERQAAPGVSEAAIVDAVNRAVDGHLGKLRDIAAHREPQPAPVFNLTVPEREVTVTVNAPQRGRVVKEVVETNPETGLATKIVEHEEQVDVER
jgi:lambda family phage portal protein